MRPQAATSRCGITSVRGSARCSRTARSSSASSPLARPGPSSSDHRAQAAHQVGDDGAAGMPGRVDAGVHRAPERPPGPPRRYSCGQPAADAQIGARPAESWRGRVSQSRSQAGQRRVAQRRARRRAPGWRPSRPAGPAGPSRRPPRRARGSVTSRVRACTRSNDARGQAGAPGVAAGRPRRCPARAARRARRGRRHVRRVGVHARRPARRATTARGQQAEDPARAAAEVDRGLARPQADPGRAAPLASGRSSSDWRCSRARLRRCRRRARRPAAGSRPGLSGPPDRVSSSPVLAGGPVPVECGHDDLPDRMRGQRDRSRFRPADR